MTLSSSISFAYRLLFPRTGKKSNARRSLFGALLCIGISLVPLIMVLTVSNGMIKGITERMIGLSSSHLQLILYPHSDYSKNAESMKIFADSIKLYDSGVKNVYPELQGIALASSVKGRFGAQIRAVESDIFEKNPSFASLFEILDGKIDLTSRNSCVLGKKLAEDLGVKAGGTIRLITTKENASGKTMPKITPLKVSGIVSSGYQELDALWLFVSLESGFNLISANSFSAVFGIETYDAFSLDLQKTYNSLAAFLSSAGRLYRWNDLNSSQYENFASTQIMLLFIMMLIVLVASVNISSALIMLVMERKKEIAILKSLGGTSAGISISFLVTGLVTGFFGVLFGLPLGLFCSVKFNAIMGGIEAVVNVFARIFYFISDGNLSNYVTVHLLDEAFYLQNIPLVIPAGQISLIVLGTLILSLLVSLFPALKAGKEKPIETLRKI
ncbi:FtsX-like permease family protein [uncultured Treponema sp.]|uniref:ABC transporter permease n=1 Tax=uncultured Treponema sp. TaxID=162155 RepID=UPI0025E8496C|nr:FtsX-like permease family protein [uncultured Treponema sp.]